MRWLGLISILAVVLMQLPQGGITVSPAGGGGTPARVGTGAQCNVAASTASACTIPSTGSGDVVVVGGAVFGTFGNNSISSVTDNKGGGSSTYTCNQTNDLGNHMTVFICYTLNSASGITQVTVNSAASTIKMIGEEEWSSVATTSASDGFAQDTTGLASPWTGANTITTTHAIDLLIGVVGNTNTSGLTFTGSGGWTNRQTGSDTTNGASMGMATRVVSSTGTYSDSGTTSAGGASVNFPGILALKGN